MSAGARRIPATTGGHSPLDSAELRSVEARLRILLAAASTASSRASLVESCRSVGQVLCDELHWDFLGIWMLESGTWGLRCTESWNRPGSGLESFDAGVRAALLVPGIGLPGRAWATRSVQWFTEDDTDSPPLAKTHPYTIMPPSAIGAGLRGGLAVPVRCDEDVLAVIEILGETKHPTDEALANLLDTIGVQIALSELRSRAELRSELAQKELEEAREQLEAVMTCAPAYIATIARDETILFLNRQWPYLNQKQAIGEKWSDFVERARQAPMSVALTKVFESGDHQFHEVGFDGPDSKPRWLSNHVGPMRIGGRIAAAVVISQDVTDAKLAEVELADAQRLASVGTLAAGVAHEINTPVQFVTDSVHFVREAAADILSLVDRIEGLQRLVLAGASVSDAMEAAAAGAAAVEAVDLEYLRENMPKACNRALEGLERVATIVRSMKEFAHPAQKEMAPVDLNRAIQSTLIVAASEYKYVADVETALDELPQVVCHVNDINQVVLNIVVNAAHAIGDRVKGTGEKGTITVRTAHDADRVVISIRDTGGGIPESVRARIFDPFFTTKEVGKGTGQGLAIAHAIVRDKHGGDLTFATEMGVGTTFFIGLPIAGKGQEAGRAATAPATDQ
jgi:signal transduction histidine kinase